MDNNNNMHPLFVPNPATPNGGIFLLRNTA